MEAEKATCIWVAKNAPDDKPEIVVSLGSTLYGDNFYQSNFYSYFK
jgi:hypothetical protein